MGMGMHVHVHVHVRMCMCMCMWHACACAWTSAQARERQRCVLGNTGTRLARGASSNWSRVVATERAVPEQVEHEQARRKWADRAMVDGGEADQNR